MAEHYYLYALTAAGASPQGLGAGVDPRFDVELMPVGRVAGVASRVGLDQFDTNKLEAGTTDLAWLGKVAVRHNAVIDTLAGVFGVLPLRLGTLFDSRFSLIRRLTQFEAVAADFLERLGDRQEWAVKVYSQDGRADRPPAPGDCPNSPGTTGAAWSAKMEPGTPCMPSRVQAGGTSQDSGTQYLAARRFEGERRQQARAFMEQELAALEGQLPPAADSWCRLRPLPTTLTGCENKMVWNGAFLVSRTGWPAFAEACADLHRRLYPKRLLLDVTGPWPPYHFCPSLEQRKSA